MCAFRLHAVVMMMVVFIVTLILTAVHVAALQRGETLAVNAKPNAVPCARLEDEGIEGKTLAMKSGQLPS